MSKIKLNSLNLQELDNLTASLGEKSFRAAQLYDWLYNKKISSVDEMLNLSKEFRINLNEVAYIQNLKEISRTVSKKDGSMKILLELGDGERVESVLLKDKDRLTACISTQVGCRMGCRFCSTAKIGLKRSLDSSEIIEQIRILEKIVIDAGYSEEARLTNIVVMGMGEPLDNAANLIKSLRVLMDEKGYGYSHKRFTVSTVGLYDKIKYLFELKTPVNLAISINAPTQDIRVNIMPISKAYPLKKLMEELEKLPLDKRDKITFEYVLIGGLNDSREHAMELAGLIKKLPAKINLIRYNGGGEPDLKPPREEAVLAFQKVLTDRGKKAFIRKSLGADIWGACGQLAAGYIVNK